MQDLPTIIFEDTDILILNKPAGMIVNKADTTKDLITVQDWVEEKVPGARLQATEELSDFQSRAGIVHRLDKDTSGILIVAKNEESFVHLQAQFKNGEVHKTYIALTHGRVVPPEGMIQAPIGRLPWNRTHFGVFPAGRQSKTLYKVLEYKLFSSEKSSEELTLLEAYPKTGRTHQIRVHFQYLGHPLFGDSLYAGRKTIQKDKKYISRHFLHATKIEFTHPKTGERIEFHSPLPEDLNLFLEKLKPIS